MTRDNSNDLADTIKTSAGDLIEELHAVRDSVEELYILLDHIWRNREELHDILGELAERQAEERENEFVVCCQCHAGLPSLAVAVSHGWTALQRDDEAEDWGYLAVCGGCQSKQIEQARQRTSAPPAMEAATSGQLQDYAVETATGDAAQSGTEREQLEAVGREMGLTTQQIEQAKAEGVTSALGLRRIEANTRADQLPETIACIYCDVDSPASLAAARQEGWVRLERDDGAGWNYLGLCPECDARENKAVEPKAHQAAPQKLLFG